jgi:hypothetical protein
MRTAAGKNEGSSEEKQGFNRVTPPYRSIEPMTPGSPHEFPGSAFVSLKSG